MSSGTHEHSKPMSAHRGLLTTLKVTLGDNEKVCYREGMNIQTDRQIRSAPEGVGYEETQEHICLAVADSQEKKSVVNLALICAQCVRVSKAPQSGRVHQQ